MKIKRKDLKALADYIARTNDVSLLVKVGEKYPTLEEIIYKKILKIKG